jgi:hypothetical protein
VRPRGFERTWREHSNATLWSTAFKSYTAPPPRPPPGAACACPQRPSRERWPGRWCPRGVAVQACVAILQKLSASATRCSGTVQAALQVDPFEREETLNPGNDFVGSRVVKPAAFQGMCRLIFSVCRSTAPPWKEASTNRRRVSAARFAPPLSPPFSTQRTAA